MSVSLIHLTAFVIGLSTVLLWFSSECSAIPAFTESSIAISEESTVGASITVTPSSVASGEESTVGASITVTPSSVANGEESTVGKSIPATPSSVAESGMPVLLFNAASSQYLFVSRDKMGSPPDNVVKTQGKEKINSRNQFVLQPVGDNRYRIFNPATGLRLFVSNDLVASDRVVEARKDLDEERTEFEFVSAGGDQYYVYNPSYGEYLFVSNNIIEGDQVLQSRRNRGEQSSRFKLLLP